MFAKKWYTLAGKIDNAGPRNQCILSIFPASEHQFYVNILVFVNINPFLYLNDQFALENIMPHSSELTGIISLRASHVGRYCLAILLKVGWYSPISIIKNDSILSITINFTFLYTLINKKLRLGRVFFSVLNWYTAYWALLRSAVSVYQLVEQIFYCDCQV